MTPNSRYGVSTHYQPPHSPQQRQSAPKVYPQPVGYPPGKRPTPRRSMVAKQRRPSSSRSPWAQPSGRLVLASGTLVALATVFVNPGADSSTSKQASADTCIKQVQTESFLSRDELSQLLKLDTPASQEEVYKVADQPFCVLAAKDGSSEAGTERQAYPLEFDPRTWFVLNYEDGKFVDYDFLFR
jgi:hypothetical protein